MDGGFLLVYGGIEENCTIRAVFDAGREELSDRVNQDFVRIKRRRQVTG